MGIKVQLRGVRGSFLHIFTPQTNVNDDGDAVDSFNGVFIIDPKSDNVAALDKAIKEVAAEKWKDKADSTLEYLIEQNRVCFHRKPKRTSSGEVIDGFDGKYWISASDAARPLVLDRDKTPLVQGDGRPYSGCYVNAIVELWAQDNPKYGRRINASLKGVQFVRHGDSFGGGTPATVDDFDTVDAPEEEGADLI